MLDRLPTPWGLVRLGVAPDHENIKAVSRAFEKTAARAGLPLLRQRRGRVDRQPRGAPRARTTPSSTASARRPTGGWAFPGEDLPGSWPATEFVAWYNGHPDFQDLGFDLSHERAVVIGNGNVAIDVRPHARADRRRSSRPTDTADEAIEAIVGAPLRGDRDARPPRARPGGVHAAGAAGARRARGRRRDRRSRRARPRRRERAGARGSTASGRAGTRAARASTPAGRPPGKPRRSVLRFLVSPVAILGEDRVEGVEVVRNELVEEDGRIVARPTGETEVIAAGLVLSQRRLPGRRAARACRSTSAARRSRTTAAASRGAEPHVLRRLDQARARAA